MTSPPSDDEIRAIRRVATRWTAAIGSQEIEQLGRLMADDIVIIHGDGRIVSGKEAVMCDIAHSLQDLSVQQTVKSEETIVAGEWAFDRATVRTIIESYKSGDKRQFDSRSITILRKENDGEWRVARTIGVIYCQT
jgi:uncharacterized protein (TIGR02246 family)